MKSLFVGQRARNRHGAYTVLAVDGDDMTIRYDDGEEAQVKQSFQARIQQNMVIDDHVAEAQAVKSATSSSRSRSWSNGRTSWGTAWHGFERGDFQDSTAGTHWRSRDSLGGALAMALSQAAGCEMVSAAPWRKAEVHICDPRVFRTNHKLGQAKFLVKLFKEHCWYGFYIERSTDPVDETWDWTRLISAARDDLSLQQKVWQAMRGQELTWKIMEDLHAGQFASITASSNENQFQIKTYEHDNPSGDAKVVGWPEWVAFLDQGHLGQWMNAYLVHILDRDRAMASGQGLASKAAETMTALLPLYRACTRMR